MACSITLTGASLECGNVGGIKTLYIAPIEDVAFVGNPVAGVIPTITMVSTKTFKKYSFRRGNANIIKNVAKDEKAGTIVITTDVSVQLNRMTVALRNEMVQLTKGQFYVIVEDYNGELWFIGYGSYCSATTGTGQTGAEMSEGNFYSLVLQAMTAEYPYSLDPDAYLNATGL